MRTERTDPLIQIQNAMEDKLLQLRSDLGQCQRRFGDFVRKVQRITLRSQDP